jgi:hypothetical protein
MDRRGKTLTFTIIPNCSISHQTIWRFELFMTSLRTMYLTVIDINKHVLNSRFPPIVSFVLHYETSMEKKHYVLTNDNAHLPIPCDTTQLTVVGQFPNGLPCLQEPLKTLICFDNELNFLPSLPKSLTKLICCVNQLKYLPPLPQSLQELSCDRNKLQCLPPLPQSLRFLSCNHNKLQRLPALPNSLKTLICHCNELLYLPSLPKSLKDLICHNNQLQCISPLPNTLYHFDNFSDFSCNPIIVCHPKDTGRFGIQLNTKKMAKIYVYAATYLARKKALIIIKRNLRNWIDKPITNDNRFGIALRIGLRKYSNQTKWNPQNMWTVDPVTSKRAYNITDLDIPSLYPCI